MESTAINSAAGGRTEIRDVTILPGGMVRLTTDAGRAVDLHPIWLREQAPDAESRDPATGQRLLDAWSLPLDLRVTEAARAEQGHLAIAFSDGHRTRFAPDDLSLALANGSDGAIPDGSGRDIVPDGLTVWDTATAPSPTAQLTDVERDPNALLALLQDLRRYGFAIVRGLPVAEDALEDFVRLIGPMRETNWGRIADVKAISNAFDLTMTSRGLESHTDNPYRDPVPGYVLLHCLANDADGGDSTITDGFRAALALRERDPEGFDTLTSVRPRFRYVDETTVLENTGPLIELDDAGQLKQVRLSNRTDDVYDPDPAVLDRYYRARHAFAAIVNDPEIQVRFKLQPGEMMMMDNYRLLHGRTSYTLSTGHRHMRQCYMDRDSMASKRLVLQRNAR